MHFNESEVIFMYKSLSEDEQKMAHCLADMTIRNAIGTVILKRYLEDKEFREKIINYLKRGG